MRRLRAKRFSSGLLVVLLFSTLLTGCWDSHELEERTSVVALAVDKVKSENSAQQLIKVTVQIPIPIKIAGSGGGAGEGGRTAVRVMSSTGLSMADALRRLQQRLNQELFYGHTRVIAVSEEVARDNMAGIIDALRRTPQMRRLLWLLITPDEAVNMLHTDPKLEQIPIVYVMDLIQNGAKQGRIPDITLGHWFIERSSTGVEPSANLIRGNDEEIKWEGLALFHGDQMIGKLSENQSWVLMNIKQDQVGGTITIPSPIPTPQAGASHCYITVRPKKVHTKTKVMPDGDTFRMQSKVKMEVDVTETMCDIDYTDEKSFRIIESALTKEMNNRAKELIADVQGKYKVDVFGLGDKVRGHYLDRYEALNSWEDEFPKTKLEINYEVLIRRVGMKMH
ncbi:Ger(x)C family spore germination protein [Tumebacillus permanentifrigoris]|uniref:Ger(X)C family germination protein n=1 Tax=Tumebacillus permanentifrigoris TaxID=378543 RepID=A0A316DTZ1_9BACL|nr:Ger(x)C family spore germination protein [Tumebacillus permanentifrigoris]PWK11483.1 Ger(x)C family germination protein [Tumebacillus permanentifrigoris]